MEKIVLKAEKRTEAPKKVRKAGLIPGVLCEHDTTSTSVQFDAAALNKIVAKHGKNAKMWVETADWKKFGFINEIQKHPTENKIIHVSIQIVEQDQDIKMQLPIAFHGRDALEQKMMHLQVIKSDIDVIGKTALMPDSIPVDISKKELGDTVTAADFSLPKGIKNLDAEHEIYAVVKVVREAPVEAPAETPAETPVAETAETAKTE